MFRFFFTFRQQSINQMFWQKLVNHPKHNICKRPAWPVCVNVEGSVHLSLAACDFMLWPVDGMDKKVVLPGPDWARLEGKSGNPGHQGNWTERSLILVEAMWNRKMMILNSDLTNSVIQRVSLCMTAVHSNNCPTFVWRRAAPPLSVWTRLYASPTRVPRCQSQCCQIGPGIYGPIWQHWPQRSIWHGTKDARTVCPGTTWQAWSFSPQGISGVMLCIKSL